MKWLLRIIGAMAVAFTAISTATVGSADAHEVLWLKQFGSTANGRDYGRGIAADGFVYVVGNASGSIPGATGEPASDWRSGTFLSKCDSSGNAIWTKLIGRNTFRNSVCIGPQGYLYLAAGQEVLKYDTDGNELWSQTVFCPIYYSNVGICTDNSGIYIGRFLQTGSGATEEYDSTGVWKLDFDGNEIWRRTDLEPGCRMSQAVGIRADKWGVYLCGGAHIPYGASYIHVRKYDADGNMHWRRQFGTSDMDYYSGGIALDNGNVYVAGLTEGTFAGQIKTGPWDIFMGKYDRNGSQLWIRQFGPSDGSGAGGSTIVTADPAGVCVAGKVAGSWTEIARNYDSDGNELWTRHFSVPGWIVDGCVALGKRYFVGNAVDTGPDAFVSGYDADLNELWTHKINSEDPVDDDALAVDTDGSIYVAGRGCTGSTVRKHDTDGNVMWTRQFAGSEAACIAVDASAVYVAGHHSGAAWSDVFVGKYDVDGTELWQRQFGASGCDYAQGISVGPTGIYVAGRTPGPLPGQTWAGNYDAYVRKYDFDGNEMWTRQFGTWRWDESRGVSVGPTGVYVCGYVRDALPGQTSAGNHDAYVRKYDTDGGEVWTRQFGSSANDLAYGISVDPSGVYVAGHTYGAFPGQTSAGGWDAFVRKYDTDGGEVWTRQFGTPTDDAITSVSVGDYGMYVAGRTAGALPGQVAEGGTDAYVRKYDHDGNELWSHQFGTPEDDRAGGVCADAAAVYTVGWSFGTFPENTSTGKMDAFIAKLAHDANTQPGNDVVSQPVDRTTGTSPVTLTFPTVNYPGSVSLTTSDVGPSLPAGFRLGNPPTYYDISVAVDYEGLAEVCIDYSDISYGKETNLKLWHGEIDPGTGDSVWTNKTTTVDTVNNIICGEVSSFSLFAIVFEYSPVELVQALITDVENLNLVQGIDNSLDAKLERAERALTDLNENNDVAAVNALGAFVNEVRAQRGDKIPEAAADVLIAKAEEIIYLLTHGGGGGQSMATPSMERELFALNQNSPNPLNRETIIRFTIPEETRVSLRIYDVSGRSVAVLVENELRPGMHTVKWTADVPTGAYFYRLQAGDLTATRKMTVVR